ncbi:MAG: sterol desaturase/sphingolipid hydroxylase (fatty acid hydroxylase superfamily) [Cycloclasticus pugetii]|jgi:sterol desaturase/sphingolipid hydroxylase (fatty acid hydroxylase superfamily)|uniref:Sterol desaturase n=2 Tax=Cycloclasticus TaxID=34067 RepID=S5T411_9GAMM|nr:MULTISPECIES: sterol desaturase family protein [Cycloclasticus]AGS38531.1 Sterol desaturase [Cycloclasticus zancles 78-ME]ATI02003.1 sterol desaturase family protein [Cycloclasticus sp. PY97N]EPD13255.1 Sterol desaturase [Cycloclasticus pugetii]
MAEMDLAAKPVLVALVLATLVMLEMLAPMFRFYDAVKPRLRHDAANILLGVLNAAIASVLFTGLVLSVTTWAVGHSFGLLNWLTLNPYLELLIALLLFDCWQYCWHRLNHAIPFLWRFHAVHHSDAAMDASSALRFHSVEIIFSSALRLLVLPIIGLSVEQLLIYELIALPIILIHHSNVAVPATLDRLLRVIIVTPHVHWVHHSHLQNETDSNYASVLSIWDRVFASFCLRDDPQKIRFGLGDRFDQTRWDQFIGQLKQPFNSALYEQRESSLKK